MLSTSIHPCHISCYFSSRVQHTVHVKVTSGLFELSVSTTLAPNFAATKPGKEVPAPSCAREGKKEKGHISDVQVDQKTEPPKCKFFKPQNK